MANTLLTIDMITREALRVLENNLVFSKFVNRQYDDQFAVAGAKIGDTLRIRKPPRFTVRTGATLSAQDVTETNVSLQLSNQKGVDINFTSKELTLNINDFSQLILQPAIAAIANQIDYDGLQLYQTVANSVGTAGTTPSTFKTFTDAKAKLMADACPSDGLLSVVIDETCESSMVDALKGLYQSSTQIASQYENGTMGRTAGFKWSMDQNINAHTVGPLGGTPLVNGASQTGSTLVTDGWTASAANRLKKGDTFTIAGVYHVNPQTRQSKGVLQQFVVTADTASDGSGNASIPIYPAITTSGAFQTVSGSPADNAALTIIGAANTVTPQNLAFHRDAFVLGTADLLMPNGVDMAARVQSAKTGLSVRMVRMYDINNDAMPCRFDVLYGWAALYPSLACRIYG